MSFLCLPPEVPESLRKADLENVSPRNLHEYFYLDKESTSSSLSGSTLKCRKPMTREQFIFMFPHVLVADSREEAGKAIRGNPELLSAAEEALKASLHAGMDEPWVEHEALMVGTLANVCGLPREVASAALVQTGYDMVSALILTEEYRENGAGSGTGWKGTGEVPSDFKTTLVHVNPSLRRLSPTSWQILHECQLRKQSLDGASEGAESVLCGRYTWSESEDEEVVTVVVKAPAGVRKGDIVSNLSPTQWTLKVRGEEECLISGVLWGVVMPDESFWTLDQSSVVMSLQKREGSERWEQLIRGELHLKQETVCSSLTWRGLVCVCVRVCVWRLSVCVCVCV